MKILTLILISVGLAACSFPTPGGGSGTIIPGYYRTTTADDPDGKFGYLVDLEPIDLTDDK